MKEEKPISNIRFIQRLLTYIVAGIVVFLCVLAFILSLKLIFFETNESEEHKSYEYQYFELNTLSNKTSVGFVSSYDQLEDEEFLHYRSESGGYVLISNFESKEYVCTGSCYCNNERRGGQVNLLSEGLIYLLVASSSVIAYKHAKEFFQQECAKEMSEKCSSNDERLESEVEDCIGIDQEAQRIQTSTEEEEKIKFVDGIYIDMFGNEIPEDYFDEEMHVQSEKYKQKYWCSGVCLPRLYSNEKAREIAYDFRCFEMKVEGEITMYFKDTAYHHVYSRKRIFQNVHLRPFCTKNSKTIDQVPGWLDFKLEDEEIASPLCVSDHGVPNPTINCRYVVDPKIMEKFGIKEDDVEKMMEEIGDGLTDSDLYPFEDKDEIDIEMLKREGWLDDEDE